MAKQVITLLTDDLDGGEADRTVELGSGNQIAPRLAATAAGRVDVAYLWDAGNGGVQATVASANPPLPGETTEAWAQPVVVQAIPASSATPVPGQLAPLGRGLGIATTSVPTAASPLAATVVAFTDTQTPATRTSARRRAPARHDHAGDRRPDRDGVQERRRRSCT